MKRNGIIICILLLAAVVFGGVKNFGNDEAVGNTLENNTAGEKLEIKFIDVGQADSILCKLPDGKVMLVDAGNNKDGKNVCQFIENEGIDKIDYLVGTHPHADHIGGMDDVINSFDIGEIFMPKASATTKTFEDVLDAISNKGMTVTTAKQGVVIDENESFSAKFLSPVKDSYKKTNEYSAVIMLKYGDNSFLLTGDMESYNESEISDDVKADVLKVAHHGSDTSSSEAFIKRVSPKLAVISVGEGNSYGHPSETVIKRLSDAGATILRTDKNGTITVQSDGKNIDYTTEK